MKILTSAILSLMLTLCLSQAFHVDLVSLGSADYAIESSVTTATYSQNLLGTTFSPSVALGDTLGGTFIQGPYDWSSYADLTSQVFLKISFTGANPNLPISLSIFNADFSLSNTYQGTTTPGDEPGYYALTLVGSSSPGALSNAGGAQITWDGGATVNANVEAIATVPEPSTYALLGLAGLALAGYAVRRRRA